MFKAILIDPTEKTITEVDYDELGSYRQIYELIDADLFDVLRLDDGDAIYVDDEGLYNKQDYFLYGEYPQPLAGRGLVLGTDEEGETIAPKISIDTVRQQVRWWKNVAGHEDIVEIFLA